MSASTGISKKAFFKEGDSWYCFRREFETETAAAGYGHIFGFDNAGLVLSVPTQNTATLKLAQLHTNIRLNTDNALINLTNPMALPIPMIVLDHLTELEQKDVDSYNKRMAKWVLQCTNAYNHLKGALDPTIWSRMVGLLGNMNFQVKDTSLVMWQYLRNQYASPSNREIDRNEEKIKAIPKFHDWTKVDKYLEEYQKLREERASWPLAHQYNDQQKIYWLTTRLDQVPYALMVTQVILTEAIKPNTTYHLCETLLRGRIKQIRESESVQSNFVANTIDLDGNTYVLQKPQVQTEHQISAAKMVTPKRCFECGSLDHVLKDCPRKRMEGGQGSQKLKDDSSQSYSNGKILESPKKNKSYYGPNSRSIKSSRPRTFDAEKWENVKKRKLEAHHALVHAQETALQVNAMCVDIGIDPDFEIEDDDQGQDDGDKPEESSDDEGNEYD